MSCIGILIAQYVEIAWLDEDADRIYGCSSTRIEAAEVALVQNNRGCYVVSCNDVVSILRFHFYIVGNLNGWLEGCIGNGVEGSAPLCIIRGCNHGFLEWDDDRIVVREGLKRDVCPFDFSGTPYLRILIIGEISSDGAGGRNLLTCYLDIFDMELSDGSHLRIELKEELVSGEGLVELESDGMVEALLVAILILYLSMLRQGADDWGALGIEEEG